MPVRPRRPCNHPGCRELTTERFCDNHKREKRKQYDEQRGDFRKRGYSSIWDKVRRLKVMKDPLCEICLKEDKITPVEIVHHIKPMDERPDLLLDMDNLQSVCRYHHARIHKPYQSTH